MTDSRTMHADTKKLATLLDPADDSATFYTGADPALILKHQLEAPLADELSSPICGPEGRATPLVNLDPSLKTFADLLYHADPPLDLLKRTKEFAKSCRAYPELLPPVVSTVIYYAAIAVARLRHHVMITELDDARLKNGLQWSIDQPWVDEKLRGLFREGITSLS
jgi:hypothetical protein